MGDLREAIVQLLRAEEFDLVVMGQGGAISDEIARHVAHLASCPVVTVLARMGPESAPEILAPPRSASGGYDALGVK